MADPLAILGWKLRSRWPPSLTTLIARLSAVEDYGDFLNLIREFLPEREADILHRSTPGAQIRAFASYFEQRYFPLSPMVADGDCEEYAELTHAIPLMVMGITYDYYCERESWEPGYRLLTYLIHDDDFLGEEDNTALAEACAQDVPEEVIQRVPEGGFSREECHRILDDSPYKAVALWADWLCHDSRNFFLDVDDDELYQGIPPDWSREEVEGLTRHWQEAQRIEQEVENLARWLEENPGAFEELLNFILERR